MRITEESQNGSPFSRTWQKMEGKSLFGKDLLAVLPAKFGVSEKNNRIVLAGWRKASPKVVAENCCWS